MKGKASQSGCCEHSVYVLMLNDGWWWMASQKQVLFALLTDRSQGFLCLHTDVLVCRPHQQSPGYTALSVFMYWSGLWVLWVKWQFRRCFYPAWIMGLSHYKGSAAHKKVSVKPGQSWKWQHLWALGFGVSLLRFPASDMVPLLSCQPAWNIMV